FRIPAAQVRAMAVDPLGERVAYADMTTGLSLVNLKSNGVEPPILLTADPRINDLKFSRDGHYLLGANRDCRIAIWDSDSHLKMADWKGHIDAVHALGFVGQSKRIASTSQDRTLAIWESSGELVSRFRAGSEAIWSIDDSSDGAWIVTGDKSGKLILWDLESTLPAETAIEFPVEGGSLGKFAARVRPSMIATTSKNAAFAIYDMPNFKDYREIGKATTLNDLHDLFVDDSGVFVLGANLKGDMVTWSIPDGQILSRRSGNTGQVFAVEFLNGRSKFITASESGDVSIQSLVNGDISRTLWSHRDLALCLALSPNGKRLASAGEDHQIFVGAIDENSIPVRQQTIAPDRIESKSIPSAITFVDDGHLLIGDRDGRILQWDLESKQFTKSYSGAEDRILVLKMSPDRKTLLAGCRDGRILCWNLNNTIMTLELRSRDGDSIKDLFFDSKGNWLVACVAKKDGTSVLQCVLSPLQNRQDKDLGTLKQ
ncbi:MAG: WD40 repeat domain-containing protein, partial [Pirellula sp.]